MTKFLYVMTAVVMGLNLQTLAHNEDDAQENQLPLQRVASGGEEQEELAEEKDQIIAELQAKKEEAVRQSARVAGLEDQLQVAFALPMSPARVQTLQDLTVSLTDALNDSLNLKTEIQSLVNDYKARFLGEALEA